MTDPTILNFADLIQPRLALCAIELGCNRSWATAPKGKVEREDVPFSYSLIGAVTESTRSRGTVRIGRNYIQRIFLFPYSGGADSLSGGAEANEIGSQWADRPYFYYAAHNTLATATLPPLRYCLQVTVPPDPGLVVRPAPGGERFACLEYTLNIVMAANLIPFSAPYSEV